MAPAKKTTAQTKSTASKLEARKPNKGEKILAERDGLTKWFTKLGWDLLPDTNYTDAKGNQVNLEKQGWKQIDPAQTVEPPSPIKE